MELEKLLGDFIGLGEVHTKEDLGIWKEKPVDLLTFFRSKDYLGESPYPGKQTELLEMVNAVIWSRFDPEKEISNWEEWQQMVNELVVMLGKGSGKDFLASGVLAYMSYLLCCLKDPQGFFNFGQDEPIDLINMAINAVQANSVFFKKFRARLANCKWFEKVNFDPSLNPEKLNGKNNCYQVLKNSIKFYKNITAHSAHSEAGSFEGYNPLFVIYDEIAGFEYENAQFAYDTFRSSAVTRYNDKFILLFISFPRSEDDFMMHLYKKAAEEKKPNVYAMIGKSWEVNPKITRESLEPDYQRDPEGSKMRYECIPPAQKEGLFSFPEKIDEVVIKGRHNPCVVEERIVKRTLADGQERFFVGLELHNLNLDPRYIYYLGGDGGVATDSYVLSLFRAEPTQIQVNEGGNMIEKWVNKPVESLLLEWKPNKKERLPVDLLNVADVIETICSQVHVKKAIFDKFNSADVVQRLMTFGVEAEDKNWSNPFQLQIYTNMKGLVYTGMVELLDYQHRQTYDNEGRLNPADELKALKIINGNKIDHDKDKSKDFSDARAGAIWITSMDEVELATNFAMPMIAGARKGKAK